MKKDKSGCLICQKPLVYLDKPKDMECVFCHEIKPSYASCTDEHFVCDECHAQRGIEAIIDYLEDNDSKNPIEMIDDIMQNEYIYMHGPEHHIMVGAVLIKAFYNAGGQIDIKKALQEMKQRGSQYPGGSCGFWGCCGAAVSVGMALSIITKTTPLSGESWGMINMATGRVLDSIGKLGGPRCCKRNSFTALVVAAKVIEEELNINLSLPKKIKCDYSSNNRQCITKKCPYFMQSDCDAII